MRSRCLLNVCIISERISRNIRLSFDATRFRNTYIQEEYLCECGESDGSAAYVPISIPRLGPARRGARRGARSPMIGRVKEGERETGRDR